jgi:Protein of unknown function (DUF3300)
MLAAMSPKEGVMFRCGKTLIALVMVMAMPVAVSAQTADKPPAPQAQPASQTAPNAELLKPEQLEALVAPIALYPDELLANVLAASTYPLEVVQADRWLKERKSLKGDALKKEVDQQSWDDSIKALTSTAEVLTMMSDKLEWTKNLGDAFLAQQPDVMDAIQRLRTKAYDNKKLVTTKQQKVSVKTEENKQVVVIEPAEPGTMYVPYTSRRPSTELGPMRTIRRTISGIRLISVQAWSRRASHSVRPGRLDAGAITGAAAATGATATSTSITEPPTSEMVGSTMRHIARACVTATPMFSSASATTI